MRIATILTLPDTEQSSDTSLRRNAGTHSSVVQLDVLGQNLLDRTVARLNAAGVHSHNVLHEYKLESTPQRGVKSSILLAIWESTVGQLIHDGADLLLLLRLTSYSELDFAQLVQFHLESGRPLTQAYGRDGSLDMAVVTVSALQGKEGGYKKALSDLMPRQRRFNYRGYLNRLRGPRDFHRLMVDGLYGRCELRPVGTEIRKNVWLGKSAWLDESVIVSAPVFVGADSRINASCTLMGPCSIERNCEIDCGTLIEDASILQNTYLGAALDVRHAVVGQQSLFHLGRNVEVNISDPRLLGVNFAPSSLLASLATLKRGDVLAAD